MTISSGLLYHFLTVTFRYFLIVYVTLTRGNFYEEDCLQNHCLYFNLENYLIAKSNQICIQLLLPAEWIIGTI